MLIALLFVLGTVSCTLFLAVNGLYSASDDVIELTPTNFNKEVIQSDSLWLVEFYAPWWELQLCLLALVLEEHCRKLVLISPGFLLFVGSPGISLVGSWIENSCSWGPFSNVFTRGKKKKKEELGSNWQTGCNNETLHTILPPQVKRLFTYFYLNRNLMWNTELNSHLNIAFKNTGFVHLNLLSLSPMLLMTSAESLPPAYKFWSCIFHLCMAPPHCCCPKLPGPEERGLPLHSLTASVPRGLGEGRPAASSSAVAACQAKQ